MHLDNLMEIIHHYFNFFHLWFLNIVSFINPNDQIRFHWSVLNLGIENNEGTNLCESSPLWCMELRREYKYSGGLSFEIIHWSRSGNATMKTRPLTSKSQAFIKHVKCKGIKSNSTVMQNNGSLERSFRYSRGKKGASDILSENVWYVSNLTCD